jgi:hypothetical protein
VLLGTEPLRVMVFHSESNVVDEELLAQALVEEVGGSICADI